MATGMAILGAIAPLIGGVMGKMAGNKNARAISDETAETKRRERAQQAETESMGRARAAASGVTLAGSPGAFLEGQQEEHARQIDWLGKAGSAKASQARGQGTMALVSGIGGGAGSAFKNKLFGS